MSVVLSIDKSGDLKINRRKCRFYKKDEVVKVAKKIGVNTNKKTTAEICASMKSTLNKPQAVKANMNNVPLAKLYPQAVKANMNNVPLAKLYPQAVKAKAKAKATAVNKKVATNFMKGMVTTNNNIAKLRQLNVKPSKKAASLTVKQAATRIMGMKTLPLSIRKSLISRMMMNKTMSPRRHVKLARLQAQLS
jgi:hypothetical protein